MTGSYLRPRLIIMRIMTLGLFFLLSLSLFGQLQEGSIQGTVTDPSGALIPNAKVTLTDIRTNTSQTFTTSDNGEYIAPRLAPGHYRVVVEEARFKSEAKTVQVVVGTPTVADFQLSVGEVSEQVVVSGVTEPLATTTADLGTVVTPETMDVLPLELTGTARQLDSFIFITPGVVGNTAGSGTIVVNGGPTYGQEILIDGQPWLNADEGGSFLEFRPPFDGVDEFKMQTNTYSAQYGRGDGVENFHFRSGTNHLHGQVFDYVRNTVFDARSFFAKNRPIQKQNDFGIRVGGPLYIPKVYDGRDKTFWNFSYEGYRSRGGAQNSLITLPQPAFLQGDFSQFRDSKGNLIPIYDPATTQPDGHGGFTRTQFPGNIIPPDRFSAISKAILPAIPASTSPALVNNTPIILQTTLPFNQGDWLLKMDHYINASNVIHGSLTRTGQVLPAIVPDIPGPLGFLFNVPLYSWQERVNYDRTISNNLINTLGIQYIKTTTHQQTGNLNTSINTPVTPLGLPMPSFSIPGITSLGTGAAKGALITIPGYGIIDNVDWIRGRHRFHIGGEIRHQAETNLSESDPSGGYTFSALTTSLPDSPKVSTLGNGLASFILGLPSNVSRTSGIAALGTTYYRVPYYAAWLQDDFRVASNLTLNLGVRYDVPLGVTARNNKMSFFDPNVANPGAGGILGATVFAGMTGGPLISAGGASLGYSRMALIDWKEVAPRFGFAYRAGDHMVVRGGYGLSYIPGGAMYMWDGLTSGNFRTGDTASQTLFSPDAGITPAIAWDQGLPPFIFPPINLSVGNGQTVRYMGRDAGRAPYIQYWDLTVGRQLPSNVLVQASYVGNKGTRNDSNLEVLDQLDPKYLSLGVLLGQDINSAAARAANIPIPYPGFSGTVAQALRPFPQFANITSNVQNTGSSTYNALQITVQKYFSQGVSFLVAYVYSKTLDDTSNSNSALGAGPLDTYNRKAEKAVSFLDSPQNLNVSGQYELPFGPGKSLVNKNGAIGKLVGGWEASWILSYRSGRPISITGGPALPIFALGANRPNVVPGVPTLASYSGRFDPAKDLYLNSAAWSQPCNFCLGNAPRTEPSTRTFPFLNENIALIKTTKITESTSLTFQAGFFNIFNRVVFGSPNANINAVNVGFGTIASQSNSPRQIQFGLALAF